ncbi:hypothetical protein PSTT_05445 [Puccinia striiformis]|uniref:Uncharacterized protein n=2 Tax=Puccinia striiformis TaxID=27350 RepID=A0A0L0VDM0_9BASI|nr:hypothetical protein PSTG_09378 [Puccinia striiformis f. sp. tritici PST-78]POW11276.1 hypothetical protein PSTT_05445 [Puccinia striiformis]
MRKNFRGTETAESHCDHVAPGKRVKLDETREMVPTGADFHGGSSNARACTLLRSWLLASAAAASLLKA